MRLATGYKILLPNGFARTVKASTMEERFEVAEKLLADWQRYCETGWMSNSANTGLFSRESRIKSFLSSLGYFLIMGADDIVTDYKQLMNGKREIPVSSCPSFIEDRVYGNIHVNSNELAQKTESVTFEQMMENADYKAGKRYKAQTVKPRKKRTVTRFEKAREICKEYGVSELSSAVVDTDNEFVVQGKKYRIDTEACPQYLPKETKSDILYDMDRIYYAKDRNGQILFFDGELEKISSSAVTETIPHPLLQTTNTDCCLL